MTSSPESTRGAVGGLRFDQPRISSACKNEIVHKLVDDLTRKGTVRVTAQVEANDRHLKAHSDGRGHR